MKSGRRTGGRVAALCALAVAAVVGGGATIGASSAPPADPLKVEPASLANTVLFSKSTLGYDCFRIPAVIQANNGALFAFAEARKGGASFCNDKGDIDLVYRRSTDNGRTWESTKVLLDGNGDVRGNPVPILDERTGRLVLLTTWECAKSPACGRRPHVQYSDDNGTTWSQPRELTKELGFATPPSWLATGPMHGIQLTRGAHAGRLVAGVNYSASGGPAGALIYSDDSGATWHMGATDIRTDGATNTPQEISVVELTDGRILAAARNQGNNDDKCLADGQRNRLQAISSDGGQTFSQRFTFQPDLITPVVQASTLRLRATDQGDKYNRILFIAPSLCGNRRQLNIRSSFDEGANWQSVSQGTMVWDLDAAYSDLVQLNNGNIGALYESGPTGDANETIRWSSFTESTLGLPDGNTSGLPVTPDSSPHGNDAYLRGGPTLSTGKFGKALSLDGTDDYVQLPFAETLATGSADFTWSGWFNYGSSTASQSLLWAYNQGDGFSQVWLRAEPGSNRIRAHVENGPSGYVTVDTTKAYNDKLWHHFALQRSGGTVTLYIDGAKAASASGLQNSVSPGRPFQIHLGQRLDGQYRLKGALDEVRLYNRALSATEISGLYSANSAIANGLRLDLDFDVTSAANTNTALAVCGNGYRYVASSALGANGTVYLMRNPGTGEKCVTTIKRTSVGTASAVSAYLEVAGEARATDSGNFSYYAGPVRKAAAGKCVKWGGSAGSASYDSPTEYCD